MDGGGGGGGGGAQAWVVVGCKVPQTAYFAKILRMYNCSLRHGVTTVNYVGSHPAQTSGLQ